LLLGEAKALSAFVVNPTAKTDTKKRKLKKIK
jgi:hypothetical protein